MNNLDPLDPLDAIEGFFISFTAGERKDLMVMLEEEGYSQNNDGVKKFLLDSCLEDEEIDLHDIRGSATERVISKAGEYLKEHPELVAQGKSLAQNIGTAINNMIKKKGREKYPP